MQHPFTEYSREKHSRYRALTVKQLFANYIKEGFKKYEIRSRPIRKRGQFVICSSQSPIVEGMISGATICKVNIYDCIQVSTMTEQQWLDAMLPIEEFFNYRNHFAWCLSDPIPVIELPVKGQLGFWNLVLDHGELIEYPKDEILKYLDFDLQKKSNRIKKRFYLSVAGLLISLVSLIGYAILSLIY